ncbi:TPA: hypothetical protein QHU55_002539 [Klebsiella aerogenes]|uniref:hypothetical protein n=1 Tax=Klebsiella aerogenes TaxID=548 RepID=UPI0027500F76|nr:hypothetical protein [Klebsiella aerogenes]HDS6533987.1 hypothetical protein [Klebsiella aerogenes]HDS7500249.1 hypothetical protein [Klebsiella aerogenes]HDS9641899.1 hypothetical protein [Klebsiella aerogenes]HDT0788029.1 hypothetical protein [Klebsiella aerogenes]
MSYERQNATKRTPAMQAALDKRAARMLRAREARLDGEMVDASKKTVDENLELLNRLRTVAYKGFSLPAPKFAASGCVLDSSAAAKNVIVSLSEGKRYNAENDMRLSYEFIIDTVTTQQSIFKPATPLNFSLLMPLYKTYK